MLTPFHQTAQIALGLLRVGIIPNRYVFVTPRIPRQGKEPVFKQRIAFLSAFETKGEVQRAEVILSMCETAQELIVVVEIAIDGAPGIE